MSKVYISNKNADEMARNVVAVLNANCVANVGSHFHACSSAEPGLDPYNVSDPTLLAVSAGSATDLATSLALTDQINRVLRIHLRHMSPVHQVSDDGYASVMDGYFPTSTLAQGIASANASKVVYNFHLVNSVNATKVHFTDDSSNAVSTTNASDQTSLNTLVNAFKTKVNAHIADSGSAPGILFRR